MSLRILTTPIHGNGRPPARDIRPRPLPPGVVEAILPGPGRDRLAGEAPVLTVTTGQQPGLFTGPLYTVHKALSAIALARRLERERGVPVVPVFWVAGDDHDFREANHAAVLDPHGALVRITLRDRPEDAPQWPLSRERCGPDVETALDRMGAALGDAPFAADTMAWLRAAYRPDASLADACADAVHALLGSRGLAVFRAHHPAAKAAAAPAVVRGLDVVLDDGLTPVLVEGRLGRDRLRVGERAGEFVTRRSGERFTRERLAALAREEPVRLSPNVLLRPVVEATLFPTVAYLAGPGELGYLPQAGPLYGDVAVQTPVPRWSGLILEAHIQHLLRKLGVEPGDLAAPPGALEGRLVRHALPPDAAAALADLRRALEAGHGHLASAAARLDATLERSVLGARNASLARVDRLERRLVAAVKRRSSTVTGQIARARAALFPDGRPQERVLGVCSFLARYGPSLLDDLEAEVARSFGAG